MVDGSFVENVVSDFASKGFGELVDSNSLYSQVEDRTLVFEPVLADEADKDSQVVGVRVFSNGHLFFESHYSDKNFEMDFTAAVLAELGVL